MVRPIRRKPIEELYGSGKHEANANKAHAVPAHGPTKTSTMRAERRHANVVNVANTATGNTTGTRNTGTTGTGNATGRAHQSEYTTSNNYIITANCPMTTTNLTRTGGGGGGGGGGVQNMHLQQHRHQMHQMHQHQMHQHQMQASARNKNLTARQAIGKKPGACYDGEPMYCGDGLPMMGKAVASGKDSQRPMQHNCWRDTHYMGGGGPGGECSEKHEGYHKHMHGHHMHKHGGIHDRQTGGAVPYQHRQHQQCNANTTPTKLHSPRADNEEDPDEFFELIKQTVQTAIGTSVSDVLNRNFRDLGTKIDRFSTELKHTNDNLARLQEHVTNRVTHYGEENSRHFRYLCMKSEYDKMFYQHQALIVNNKQPPEPPNFPTEYAAAAAKPENSSKAKDLTTRASVKQKSTSIRRLQEKPVTTTPRSIVPMTSSVVSGTVSSAGQAMSVNYASKLASPYVCQSTQKAPSMPSGEPDRSSSGHSIEIKSSDVGMREVLEHIQRFVTEMQYKEFSADSQTSQQQQQQKPQQNKHLQQQQQQQQQQLSQLSQRGKKPKNLLDSISEMINTKTPPAERVSSVSSSTPKNGRSYGDIDDDFDISSDCLSLITDNSNDESDLPDDYECHTARNPLKRQPASGAGDCK